MNSFCDSFNMYKYMPIRRAFPRLKRIHPDNKEETIMKKNSVRFLALFLAVCLTAGLMALPALADA